MLGLLGGLLSGGLGGLGGILGGSSVKKAANRNNQLLDNLQSQGNQYIDQGSNAASGYLGGVQDLFKNLSQESGGLSGLNLYGDALGVNGAGGTSRARDAFQTNPGYEFQQQQGLDALERRAAAQGRLSSGQTGLDTLQFSQGLADQSYQNWLNNLSGFGQQQAGIYTGGIQGQAGALSDLANLSTGTANQRLDLLGEITNGKMGVNNQKASGSNMQYQGGLGGLAKGLGSFGGYL